MSWYHLGPHAFFDLVRLARRGRGVVVRVLYILALFTALAIVYQTERSRFESNAKFVLPEAMPPGRLADSINFNARIAEKFSITILLGQLVAIVVLMPIYIASSVHEERDTRSLGLLFTTDLTAREILLGKLVARMGYVGSVLLAGLPMLALIQLWGGIDMPMIACNFWNAGLWLLSIGSFSLMIATQSRTLARSILSTYLRLAIALVIPGTCCTCIVMAVFRSGSVLLLQPDGQGEHGYFFVFLTLWPLTLAHFLLAVICLRVAALNLDRQRGEELGPETTDALGFEKEHDRVMIPPIADDAIPWKERYLDRSIVMIAVIPGMLTVFTFYLIFLAGAVWFAPHAHYDPSRVRELADVFHVFLLLSAGTYVLLVTVRLASCVSHERERQTLDALLTLPMDRDELLSAKQRGIFQRYWVWFVPIGLCWVVAALLGDAPRALALLLVLAIHLFFFSQLGLLFSVVCRSTLAAYIVLAIMLMAMLGGTLLLPTSLTLAPGWVLETRALNPIACWLALSIAPRDGTVLLIPSLLLSLTIYFASGLLLRQVAYRRFARDLT